MKSNKKLARLAGVYYLFVVVFSIFYMEYVPEEIVVYNDAEATLNNLISNEFLFRIGILIT